MKFPFGEAPVTTSRWLMSVLFTGVDPYRTEFLAAGVGSDQLAPDFATPSFVNCWRCCCVCFPAGVGVYGYLRWLRNEKAMRLKKEDLPYTNSLLIVAYVDGRGGDRYGTGVVSPDSARSQTHCRPGLQPERTSLAWFRRTMLGYVALMALAVKHNWHQGGHILVRIGILAIVALISLHP